MTESLPIAAACVSAYFAGSIPFAYLAVKMVKGVDIRTVGSGNVGATNAGRILGRPAAVGIYLLDSAKGAGAVLLGRWIAPGAGIEIGCGLLAIIGHVFPVWLKFRGGKGVATATGVFVALHPVAMLIAGAAWLLTAAVTRLVSIASIALAFAFPAAILLLRTPRAPGEAAFRDGELPLFLFACAAGLFIIIRHIPNIRRVLAGTEPRMFTKR